MTLPPVPSTLALPSALAVAVAVTRGRTPFRLAVLMALVDVVLLTTATHQSRPGR